MIWFYLWWRWLQGNYCNFSINMDSQIKTHPPSVFPNEWLNRLGLQDFERKLKDMGVTESGDLKHIEENDLQEMGMSEEQQQKFLKETEALPPDQRVIKAAETFRQYQHTDVLNHQLIWEVIQGMSEAHCCGNTFASATKCPTCRQYCY